MKQNLMAHPTRILQDLVGVEVRLRMNLPKTMKMLKARMKKLKKKNRKLYLRRLFYLQFPAHRVLALPRLLFPALLPPHLPLRQTIVAQRHLLTGVKIGHLLFLTWWRAKIHFSFGLLMATTPRQRPSQKQSPLTLLHPQ